jgi:hypothetical protein
MNMDMNVDDIDWAESERPVGVVLKKNVVAIHGVS